MWSLLRYFRGVQETLADYPQYYESKKEWMGESLALLSFYHRRPNKVHMCGSSNDNEETLAQWESRFCKRCGYKLIWREDINNLFCCVCAWEPPKELKAKVEKQEWENI